MKIDSPGKTLASSSVNEIRPRASVAPLPTGGAQVEDVKISSLSTSLQKAERAMAEAPVVDQQRVDEIRQAISEGRFKINAGRIADGLIESVRDLLGNQR